jgi:hypothetical protein
MSDMHLRCMYQTQISRLIHTYSTPWYVIFEARDFEYKWFVSAMQVRYSAAWSTATRKSFVAAVTAALSSATAVKSLEVTLILRKWRQSIVSLVAARRGWAELCTEPWAKIGTFLRQEDQLALC